MAMKRWWVRSISSSNAKRFVIDVTVPVHFFRFNSDLTLSLQSFYVHTRVTVLQKSHRHLERNIIQHELESVTSAWNKKIRSQPETVWALLIAVLPHKGITWCRRKTSKIVWLQSHCCPYSHQLQFSQPSAQPEYTVSRCNQNEFTQDEKFLQTEALAAFKCTEGQS